MTPTRSTTASGKPDTYLGRGGTEPRKPRHQDDDDDDDSTDSPWLRRRVQALERRSAAMMAQNENEEGESPRSSPGRHELAAGTGPGGSAPGADLSRRSTPPRVSTLYFIFRARTVSVLTGVRV